MSDYLIETAMAWGAVAGAGITVMATGVLGHSLGSLSVSLLVVVAFVVEYLDTDE